MSLDLSLRGPATTEPCTCECGHLHTRVERPLLFDVNITNDLNRMASEAGLYQAIWHSNGARAGDLVRQLADGVRKLANDPARFLALRPANQWGSYNGLLATAREFLEACRAYPDAIVEADR